MAVRRRPQALRSAHALQARNSTSSAAGGSSRQRAFGSDAGTGWRYTLSLPAGECTGVSLCQVRHSEARQPGVCAAPGGGPTPTADFGWRRRSVAHREVREEEQVLEHDADPSLVSRKTGQILVPSRIIAVGLGEACDRAMALDFPAPFGPTTASTLPGSAFRLHDYVRRGVGIFVRRR